MSTVFYTFFYSLHCAAITTADAARATLRRLEVPMRCLIVFVSLLACLLSISCDEDPAPATDDCPPGVEMPEEASATDAPVEVTP